MEHRVHAAEAEARGRAPRVADRGLHQERRLHRAVDDEARIFLDLARVVAVVVDAVGVVGRGGVAEEPHRVRPRTVSSKRGAAGAGTARGRGRRRGWGGRRCPAPPGSRRRPAPRRSWPTRTKAMSPGRARLELHAQDLGPLGRSARRSRSRRPEGQPPARPHAPVEAGAAGGSRRASGARRWRGP